MSSHTAQVGNESQALVLYNEMHGNEKSNNAEVFKVFRV